MKRLLVLALALAAFALVPLSAGSSDIVADPACDGTIPCVKLADAQALEQDVRTMTRLFEQANHRVIVLESDKRILQTRVLNWKQRAQELARQLEELR